MTAETSLLHGVGPEEPAVYRLEEQIGFLLRRASQRHLAIFAKTIPALTPPQWAALVTLSRTGDTAQNRLGQLVAMDAATIKGVIDRLKARGLVGLGTHDADRRRVMVGLTAAGRTLVEALLGPAQAVTEETLAPLSEREAATLKRLLARLG